MVRILLVDDDDHFRAMLHKTLARAGYEVTDAKNGKVALQRFRESPVDVVITDLVMPEKEGLETIMELRKARRDVKIIAISGGLRSSPADYLAVASKFGAQRTLAKPFSHQDILRAVTEVVSLEA